MAQQVRRDIFQAIADPTRRGIIDLLAGKPQNLHSLADHFDISRPAISQQIKILVECGVVVVTRQGRESYCEARLDQLNAVSTWMEKHRRLWEDRFDSIERLLKEKHRTPGKKARKPKK